MDWETDESRAVLGHIAGFLLPLVGPVALLVASRGRSRVVREHLLVSAVVSAAWFLLAVTVISVDVGHLSVDEQQTSTGGLVALLVVAAAVLAIIVMNVQRAKRQKPPLGWFPR